MPETLILEGIISAILVSSFGVMVSGSNPHVGDLIGIVRFPIPEEDTISTTSLGEEALPNGRLRVFALTPTFILTA
jgi:hypothetical protein